MSWFGIKQDRLHAPRNRGGFTLTELAVSTGIVGIILALTFPAIQGVRETARMTSHQNDAKQVALALHHFETIHKHLPAAVELNPSKNSDPAYNQWVTWQTLVLPYLDQQALYELYNFKKPAQEQDQRVLTAFIPPLHAGSERNELQTEYYAQLSPVYACQFLAVGDDGVYRDPTTGWEALINTNQVTYITEGWYPKGALETAEGMMPPHHTTRLAEVTDGLSNTTMLVGFTLRPNTIERTAYDNPGNVTINGADQNGFYHSRHTFGVHPLTVTLEDVGLGQVWTVLAYGVGQDNADKNNVTNSLVPSDISQENTVMAMGDGSVIMVNPYVDMEVLRKLARRNDGKVLGSIE